VLGPITLRYRVLMLGYVTTSNNKTLTCQEEIEKFSTAHRKEIS